MDLDQAREILIQHSRSKRNGTFPRSFTHQKQLTNPICGDHVEIKFEIKDNHIAEIGFNAKACAICSASTSIMSEVIKGQSLSATQAIAEEFERSILEPKDQPWPASIQNLRSFEHLKINHSRRTCALLPWVAFKSALKEGIQHEGVFNPTS